MTFELNATEYEVTAAQDGQEALEYIQKEKFDLLITDIMMPKMDGLELLKEVKKINPSMEVIITTGYAHVDNAVQAMKTGAYDFIQKPYSIDQLLAVTEKALEKSKLINARDAALEASRAKSEFLATMSHEIRTPLNSIIGMAELLMDSHLSDEQQEYVQILKRGGETLLGLINDILDLSKVESGCLELEETEIQLTELIERTIEFIAIRAHQKGLEIISNIHPDVPLFLLGDPNRIRQILFNLLSNAIKFTAKGEIILKIEKISEEKSKVILRFSVTDTGIGIPEDKTGIIFSPFTQVDSSTTRKYGGTGLGLSISKKLVELIGGKIWVTSKIGEGSTFCFEIPLKRHLEVLEVKDKSESSEAMDLEGVKTLIVDDNATNRLILKETLGLWKIPCCEVISGQACLDALRKAEADHAPYQLILLDCRMPEMDGFQVAEAIQKELKENNLIVMMLTSDSRHGDIARSKSLGINGYLVKPIKKMELFAAIKATLKRQNVKPKPQKETSMIHANLPSEGPAQILVAEDAEDNRLLIEMFLKKASYQLDYAKDGKQTVEKVKEKPYDLILMDMNMPILDGFQATKQIRKWEQENSRRPIGIIALTANALKESRGQCLEAGCDDYLMKPIKKAILMEKIKEYLEGDKKIRTFSEGR